MIKIVIADDHAIVREGLKQIVSETEDMVVAGEAEIGAGGLTRRAERATLSPRRAYRAPGERAGPGEQAARGQEFRAR